MRPCTQKALLEEHGCKVILMDISLGAYKESPADFSCVDVAKEAGVTFDVIRNTKGTSEPMDHMIKGATKITQALHKEGSIDCIAGLGGASNTTFFSWVMRRLPFGFPEDDTLQFGCDAHVRRTLLRVQGYHHLSFMR